MPAGETHSIGAAPACHGCVARELGRREFLSAAALAAVAVVLEACSDPKGVDFFTGPTGGALTVRLSDFGALASVGGVARVDGGHGAPTALVRTGASSFTALSMVCTHQGATIDITSTGFKCPNHGAQFGKDGTWQASAQFASTLHSFSTTFDSAAGTVTIARPA